MQYIILHNLFHEILWSMSIDILHEVDYTVLDNRGNAPDNKEVYHMQKVVNAQKEPGKETADNCKVSRGIVEALGASLAVIGKELVSVSIICKDEDMLFEYDYDSREAADD